MAEQHKLVEIMLQQRFGVGQNQIMMFPVQAVL